MGMHAARRRRARQIHREWAAERAASGESTQPGVHPLIVFYAVSMTLMMILFWVGVGLALNDVPIPDTNTGKDETVAFIVSTGGLGAWAPWFWWVVLTESLPPESAWHHPLRAFSRGLAYVASPDDAAWREEWPALLTRRPGEPRHVVRTALTVTGWVWAALCSRAGWILDVCLQSDAVCALAAFGATFAATWAAWDAAGIAEAVMTAILTFTGCVASIDGLCRWRGIELPRKRK
ncbi:hypothetical protein OG895_43495 [Streptomyces sp. NBC_00201]|uniref:hypothetical protein n=1 Tax=unclassified Streptomyces TaxID=2593676 RepID=UPI00224E5998|nr:MULTISPECIES: hypothetical protein [unclassified Streptomyces]MCX5063760.1 hypothetical protein [Streptomyces sp. NBC_00452]MCX5251915.1 hypothetical protein [Streptomyces sp. NBC_00201]MCX5294182.1 hypothetical protein [Streptomyces sp. NBC_00183]